MILSPGKVIALLHAEERDAFALLLLLGAVVADEDNPWGTAADRLEEAIEAFGGMVGDQRIRANKDRAERLDAAAAIARRLIPALRQLEGLQGNDERKEDPL